MMFDTEELAINIISLLLSIVILIGIADLAGLIEVSGWPRSLSLYLDSVVKFEGGDPKPLGKWARKEEQQEGSGDHKSALRGLGYSDGVIESTGGRKGIVANKVDSTYPGVNLYNAGHAPVAYLIDINGKYLHRWEMSWGEAFPNVSPREAATKKADTGPIARSSYWGKVHLLSNGDLLAIFHGLGMIKLDRDSNLLWSKKIGAHHDFWVSSDEEKYFVLTREPRELNIDGKRTPLMEELVTILDKEGNILEEVSLHEAILNSPYAERLKKLNLTDDILNSNAIQILEDVPAGVPDPFEQGKALISIRKMNLVGLVDLEKPTLEWVMEVDTYRQHDPTLLSNGNLLVFDNRRADSYSRVIEVDPLRNEIEWKYEPSAREFFSRCCGRAQRLPNGNTLITETMKGRAFEVDRDGDVVWDFFVPHRTGEDEQFISQLFELRRLPEDKVIR